MAMKRKMAWIGARLVYWDTGRVVPHQDKYTVKQGAKGRQSIYKEGKFIGYVTPVKGDKATELWRMEEQRVYERERKFAKTKGSAYKEKAVDFISDDYRVLANRKYYETNTPAAFSPLKVQSAINYATYLNNAVTAGCISHKDAMEWFRAYKKATTDDERNELWSKVKVFALGEGYADSQ